MRRLKELCFVVCGCGWRKNHERMDARDSHTPTCSTTYIGNTRGCKGARRGAYRVPWSPLLHLFPRKIPSRCLSQVQPEPNRSGLFYRLSARFSFVKSERAEDPTELVARKKKKTKTKPKFGFRKHPSFPVHRYTPPRPSFSGGNTQTRSVTASKSFSAT